MADNKALMEYEEEMYAIMNSEYAITKSSAEHLLTLNKDSTILAVKNNISPAVTAKNIIFKYGLFGVKKDFELNFSEPTQESDVSKSKSLFEYEEEIYAIMDDTYEMCRSDAQGVLMMYEAEMESAWATGVSPEQFISSTIFTKDLFTEVGCDAPHGIKP